MYKHKVMYYETDMMGIVHHSNHIRWMEEARIDYLEKLGWAYDKLEEEGLISPILAVDCKYKKSVKFGETVSIEASVYEFKGVKIKFQYTITNENGEVVCISHSEHCFLNKKGMPISLAKVKPELYQTIVNEIKPIED